MAQALLSVADSVLEGRKSVIRFRKRYGESHRCEDRGQIDDHATGYFAAVNVAGTKLCLIFIWDTAYISRTC